MTRTICRRDLAEKAISPTDSARAGRCPTRVCVAKLETAHARDYTATGYDYSGGIYDVRRCVRCSRMTTTMIGVFGFALFVIIMLPSNDECARSLSIFFSPPPPLPYVLLLYRRISLSSTNSYLKLPRACAVALYRGRPRLRMRTVVF